MRYRFTIVGIGEALFDVIAGEERLGGAPLNVAVHAHQLAAPRQGRGVLVSRVGQDDLGQDLIRQLKERGVETSYIQHDPDRPTGQVFVDTDDAGQPTYDIVRGAAWDMLWFESDLEDLAQTCNAVCFGSLAQREAQTRNAIYRFLDTCRRATRLFDVNLRPPFYNPRIIRHSCELADIVKLNIDELPIVCDQVGAEGEGAGEQSDQDDPTGAFVVPLSDDHRRQAEALRQRYDLEMVVVTRGEQGTVAVTSNGWAEGAHAHYQPTDNANAVGAGDACAAAIMLGQTLHWPVQQTLDLANHLGAYVAGQGDATPELPQSILDIIKNPK